jgi:preprotein translocase subunit SecB
MAAVGNGAAEPQQQAAQIVLQKLYVKDSSFEAPGAPQIFQDDGQPQLQLNMQQKVGTLTENVYEVVLSVTLTCSLGEKTAYLAEVHQAGIFGIAGFAQVQLDAVLGSYCPNVLFPYVRQSISDMVASGGFPPYLLQPINFDQLYAETLRRRNQPQVDVATAPAAGNA